MVFFISKQSSCTGAPIMTWEGSFNSQLSTSAVFFGWYLVSCNGVTRVTALLCIVCNAAHIIRTRSGVAGLRMLSFSCPSCSCLCQNFSVSYNSMTFFLWIFKLYLVVYESMKMKCLVLFLLRVTVRQSGSRDKSTRWSSLNVVLSPKVQTNRWYTTQWIT